MNVYISEKEEKKKTVCIRAYVCVYVCMVRAYGRG